jgi:hypothetical protein
MFYKRPIEKKRVPPAQNMRLADMKNLMLSGDIVE